jgi:hypothetical protein
MQTDCQLQQSGEGRGLTPHLRDQWRISIECFDFRNKIILSKRRLSTFPGIHVTPMLCRYVSGCHEDSLGGPWWPGWQGWESPGFDEVLLTHPFSSKVIWWSLLRGWLVLRSKQGLGGTYSFPGWCVFVGWPPVAISTAAMRKKCVCLFQCLCALMLWFGKLSWGQMIQWL